MSMSGIGKMVVVPREVSDCMPMKSHLIILTGVAIMLVSCLKGQHDIVEDHQVRLSIAAVRVETSKATVDGNDFPELESCSLGLFLTTDSGSGYDNVEFVKEAGSRRWTGSSPLTLTDSPTVVYAYYPYNPAVSDMADIPIRSSLDGEDYMYAVPVSGVSASNPEVTLEMRHALALICLNLSKGEGYSGDCKLTSISLTGEGIAAIGTMDASDGSIGAVASEFVANGFEHSFSSALSEKLLVIPALVSSERQTVKVACTIDGEHKELTFQSTKGLIVKQGVKFSVNITVSGTGLKISGVSITDWNGGTIMETGLVEDGIIITGAESGQYGGEIEF